MPRLEALENGGMVSAEAQTGVNANSGGYRGALKIIQAPPLVILICCVRFVAAE
jgi:hypothetical protein